MVDDVVLKMAAETLARLTPDICFLGASGLDPAAGVTTNDEAESAINRVMMQQAKRTIVVVDGSKLGHVGFSRICHLSEVSTVLTDSSADPAVAEQVRALGPDVIIV